MGEWRLDHVFLLVSGEAEARAIFERHGLIESRARPHPGQGTANLCCAFEDAYLELLWLDGSAIEPWAEPLRWRERVASAALGRLGIALRGPDRAPPFAHWRYRPGYLPEGEWIPIANASDDPDQPLLFRSPGDAPPSAAFPVERRMSGAMRCRLIVPPIAAHSECVALACSLGAIGWRQGERAALEIAASSGGPELVLPIARSEGERPPQRRPPKH